MDCTEPVFTSLPQAVVDPADEGTVEIVYSVTDALDGDVTVRVFTSLDRGATSTGLGRSIDYKFKEEAKDSSRNSETVYVDLLSTNRLTVGTLAPGRSPTARSRTPT